MNFSYNQKLAIIGIIAIASVIAIPYVYAVVEPHIKITMDSGQTTEPFTIYNKTGYKIFSVSTDGRTDNIFRVSYNIPYGSDVQSATSNIVSDPKFLWKYHVNHNGFSEQFDSNISMARLTGQGLRDSGAGTCKSGVYGSDDDGVSWYSLEGDMAWTSGSGEGIFLMDNAVHEASFTVTDIALIMYNTNGSTVCSITDLTSYVEIFVSQNWTLERVV